MLTLTDTQRAELRDALARAEHLAREHARILEGCLAIVNEPPVDMLADPLRSRRTADGRVAYAEEAARWVIPGDWVQAVHGDGDRWEQVAATVHADTQTGITTRTDSGDTRLRWWDHGDKVRVATAPVQVVADQERKWENPR